MVSVVAINKPQRIVILDDESLAPFDTLIDQNGDVTDDTDDAVCVLVKLPDGEWETVTISDFEPQWLN